MAEPFSREELNEALHGQTEQLMQFMRASFEAERVHTANLIRESEDRQTELMRGVETKLLRSFHDYSKIADIRFRKLEANEGNSNKAVELRLAMIEAQLLEVQTRLIEGGL